MRRNIVESWLAVATASGEPVSYALSELNAELGTNYQLNRLGEWRNGRRSIPQPVQNYMLRCCIAWAIKQEGGIPPYSDDALDRLADRLSPPERETIQT